jgi:nitrogen regulatory protein PII
MFHPATKLIVITENFILKEVCAILEACGATGYTLVPAGGKGLHHFHATSNTASVVDDFANVKIEVVCRDRARAEQMAGRILKECFQDYPGIMYLEQVEVMRPEHF